MSKSSRITYIGIMVALALVLQLIESFIPLPYFAPGVKLGLANIVSLIAIIYFNFKTGLLVVMLRTFMAAFLSGRLYSFFYSGVGAILSILIMALVYRYGRKYFSLQGISILGAVAHNIGQIIVAGIVLESINVISYLPVLMLSAIVTGYFIGLCATFLSEILDKTVIRSNNKQPENG